MKNGVIIILLVLCAGCSTCRFSLVDLDLRSPSQITAYQTEAEIPYAVPVDAALIQTSSITGSIWTEVCDLLKVVKARFRIISIEYRN